MTIKNIKGIVNYAKQKGFKTIRFVSPFEKDNMQYQVKDFFEHVKTISASEIRALGYYKLQGTKAIDTQNPNMCIEFN